MQEIIRIDLGGVNSYLIKNNNRFLLVDTGGHLYMDREYTDRRNILVQELEKNGVTPENLDLIILTHGDNDHVCNTVYIRDKYNTKTAMNEADVWMVDRKQTDSYEINSKYESIVLTIGFKLLKGKIRKLMTKVYQEFQTFTPDYLLEDGQSLEDFGFEGRIYHVPGHTKGSIAILDTAGNLIAGDIFANNGKPSIAVNAENFDEIRKQAEKLLSIPVKMIYPGHGAEFNSEQITIKF